MTKESLGLGPFVLRSYTLHTLMFFGLHWLEELRALIGFDDSLCYNSSELYLPPSVGPSNEGL